MQDDKKEDLKTDKHINMKSAYSEHSERLQKGCAGAISHCFCSTHT